MPGVIIPRKTVNELRKLLDEVTGNVEVALSDTRIQFQRRCRWLLTSKLIDGTFPEYERVNPRGNDKVLRRREEGFRRCGRAASPRFPRERSRPVKLSLNRDLLVLSAASPGTGTATEELDSDHVTYEAGPLEIGFQARYLNDITDQIEGDVEFRFADGSAPTVVRDAAGRQRTLCADADAGVSLAPLRLPPGAHRDWHGGPLRKCDCAPCLGGPPCKSQWAPCGPFTLNFGITSSHSSCSEVSTC